MSAAARAARAKRRPLDIHESSRQLRRATLGVHMEQMSAVVGQRIDQWVDAQLALSVTPEQAITTNRTRHYPGFPSGTLLSQYIGSNNQFVNWKVFQPELLRTRLVYAVLEFFSVGGGARGIFGGGTGEPHMVLWDIIEGEVTQGTFRSLIEKITYCPVMSRWLTYYQNAKTDGVRQPDENYARELMQLYTIGLWELNLDGSRKKTGELEPSDPRYVAGGTDDVPTYAQADITNMARVFTGMTLVDWPGYPSGSAWSADDSFAAAVGAADPDRVQDVDGHKGWRAKLTFAPSYHETSLPKVALQGRVNIPVGTNGPASLAAVLNVLVAHPSAAPYLATRFIRLLTTSNPSPEYIARVASVFRDDGTGQAGNLRAFFRAILLDQEALAPVDKGLTCRIPSYEEQRLALVLSYQPRLTTHGEPTASGSGGEYPGNGEDNGEMLLGMGLPGPLQIFQNPSVFGRWPAAYAAAGPVFDAGLKSPELATLTEGSVTDLIDEGGSWYERCANVASAQDRADAMTTGNRAALIDRLDFLLTGGALPQSFKDALLNRVNEDFNEYYDGSNDRVSIVYRSIVVVIALSPWAVARK